MKTGEMNADLDEFIEDYLKELRHKKMTKDRCLTVYIAYSKLNEKLPRIINSLKVIKGELDAIGSSLTINKAQGSWTW